MAIHCNTAKDMSHSHMENKMNLLVIQPFSIQLRRFVNITTIFRN